MTRGAGTRASRLAAPATALGAALVAAGLSACISGRVLRGYPGYPFASFSVPGEPDSTFYSLQRSLEAEGFPIDFTERESGVIHTRTRVQEPETLLLTVVVGPDRTVDGRTEVWVAGFEEARAGARRVSPLDERLWGDVMEVSARLSERMSGTPPLGPDERAEAETET